MNDKAIEFINVSKSYTTKGLFYTKTKKVLDNVNFQVNKGEIVGLIGLNGAGKTTIIKIMCGITWPSSGIVKIFGDDIRTKNSCKHRIGYTSETPHFHGSFRVKDIVSFFCYVSGKECNKDMVSYLIDKVNLKDWKDEKVSTLSKGTLQKLAIACALSGDPDILVLDEPTTGLDLVYIKQIRDIILELNYQGKTIFFSSHNISEIESISHRVLLLHKGKIISSLTRDEFSKNSLSNLFIKTIEDYG